MGGGPNGPVTSPSEAGRRSGRRCRLGVFPNCIVSAEGKNDALFSEILRKRGAHSTDGKKVGRQSQAAGLPHANSALTRRLLPSPSIRSIRFRDVIRKRPIPAPELHPPFRASRNKGDGTPVLRVPSPLFPDALGRAAGHRPRCGAVPPNGPLCGRGSTSLSRIASRHCESVLKLYRDRGNSDPPTGGPSALAGRS
jgi:hypothetical protein